MNFLGSLCLLLAIFGLSASEDDPQNICDLPGLPMYCNCDEIYLDEAKMVSCYMSTNMTIDDVHWRGFSKQKNIESLVFISRETAYLTYVPTSVLTLLPKLHHFALAEAQLGILGPFTFTKLNSLKTINVERDGITGLENRAVAHLPSLLKMTISDNKISEVPSEAFIDLPRLEELYLEHNEIQRIHDGAFSQLHALKELDLFNNQLKHLNPKSLAGLKSLQRLDVSRNRLSTLKDHVFRGTPQLRNLDLSHNRLSHISDRAFDHLSHLVNLRLKENRLVSLPDSLFRGSPNLISLAVTGNHLITFQDAIVKFLVNQTDPNFAIYLKDNKFQCNCDMFWVGEFAKTSVNTFFRTELQTIECTMEESDHKTKHRISSLTAEDLNCKERTATQSTYPTTSTIATTTMPPATTVKVFKHIPVTKALDHNKNDLSKDDDLMDYHDDSHRAVADKQSDAVSEASEHSQNDRPKNIELKEEAKKDEDTETEEMSSNKATTAQKKAKNSQGNGADSCTASSLLILFVLSWAPRYLTKHPM